MDMFQHHHIADNLESIANARLLQRVFEEITRRWHRQVRTSSEATERDKMQVPILLMPRQSRNHAGILQSTA
jgi:hypothetical protein